MYVRFHDTFLLGYGPVKNYDGTCDGVMCFIKLVVHILDIGE
jgi:hypothetical protein